MKFTYRSNNIILLLLLGISSLLFSCESTENNHEVELIEVGSISEYIQLSNEQIRSAQIEVGKLQKRPFYESIKSYGVIDVPPENKASVSAYFGGYVKKLRLLEGQKVTKGDVLFTLENPNYLEIQQAFLESKGQLNYLKSDYERQKSLAKDNVSSQKKYLKAEADYKVTLARYASLKKKLQLMNINPNTLSETTIQSQINLTAPLSGTITTVNATVGMFLNPDDIALTIINSDHIHLDLHVFEKDLSKIYEGQEISFSLQNDIEHEYEAYVYLVGNYIDPVKRTASIHGHLKDEAENHLFIPGMYIEAEIKSASDSLFAIYEDAIVMENDKYYVLVKVGEENDTHLFEKREVILGLQKNAFSEIKNVEDFKKDDYIMLIGAFNLIGSGGGHSH